jgi:hypothetical protein
MPRPRAAPSNTSKPVIGSVFPAGSCADDDGVGVALVVPEVVVVVELLVVALGLVVAGGVVLVPVLVVGADVGG